MLLNLKNYMKDLYVKAYKGKYLLYKYLLEYFFSSFLCDCAVNPNEVAKVYDVSVSYQAATKELIAPGTYDDKDDFTVVVQPFMEHMTVPLTVISKFFYEQSIIYLL